MIENLSENERLLLMAAAVHGLGPGTDLSRANTYKVVRQVILWSRRIDDEVCRAWCQELGHPELDEIYDALLRMVDQSPNRNGMLPNRPGPALFVGAGQWGNPDGDPACAPQFNSCRLTALGEREARRLLDQHPHYRDAGPNLGWPP